MDLRCGAILNLLSTVKDINMSMRALRRTVKCIDSGGVVLWATAKSPEINWSSVQLETNEKTVQNSSYTCLLLFRVRVRVNVTLTLYITFELYCKRIMVRTGCDVNFQCVTELPNQMEETCQRAKDIERASSLFAVTRDTAMLDSYHEITWQEIVSHYTKLMLYSKF